MGSHRRSAIRHAAGEQCGSGGQRAERHDVVGSVDAARDLADAALSPGGGTFALACTLLRVDASGIELGEASTISMGSVTRDCDRRAGEIDSQQFVLLSIAWVSSGGRRVSGGGHELAARSDDPRHSGTLPAQPRIVVRTDLHGNLPGISSAVPAVSKSAVVEKLVVVAARGI